MMPAPLSTVANHVWQSTLFAGAAALLALMLRRNQAEVRYRLWLAASIKFLIPSKPPAASSNGEQPGQSRHR